MDIDKFIKNRQYFNISSIEDACNIPSGVLRGVVSGGRRLPEKYESGLEGFITGILVDITGGNIGDISGDRLVGVDLGESIPNGYELMDGRWRLLVSGKYTDGDRKVEAIEIGGKLYVPG